MHFFRLLLLLVCLVISKSDTVSYLDFDPTPKFIPKEKLAQFLSESKYYQDEKIDSFYQTFIKSLKKQ